MRTIIGLCLTMSIMGGMNCGTTSKAFVSKDFDRKKHKNIIIAKSNDKAFSDVIVLEFMGIGVSIIDRQNMDSMLKEHELAQGGTVDAATAKQIGKITGADAMLVLEWYGGMYPLAKLQLIDTESGAILMSAVFKQTGGDAVSKTHIAESFASKIKGQI